MRDLFGRQIKGIAYQFDMTINVVIIANMRADLILRHKDVTSEGDIIEMTVWSLPEPLPPSGHAFKYSLVYIVGGKRVVGFDNERGKGDHCHLDGKEKAYRFIRIDQFVRDFIRQVDKRRKQ